MKRISIIGSGNVGANAAFFIVEKGIADVTLFDTKEGVPEGNALDIMEAAPIRTYRSTVNGAKSFDEIRGSDVVMLAAGSVRKPGMMRKDLFEENLQVVKKWSTRVSELAPESTVIVMTEPVDLLTTVFTRESGMKREQILGIGGVLDSTRLVFAISRDLGVSPENVSALVIGQHGSEMIGLAKYSCVSGVPVLNLMLPEQFESMVNEVRNAGDFIVEMAKRSSAYYAPSAAAAEVADAVCRNTRRILSLSQVLEGEYGVEGIALSVPTVVGERGASRIFLPQLSEPQKDQFVRSAEKMLEKLGRKSS
jgi:malate dehydrogenase